MRAGRAPRVGMVANLRPVKEPEILLRAARLVHSAHPDAVFQIAGEGELRPELEKQIEAFGLKQSFQLVGAAADVPAFLAGLDVAVLCSRSEGQSNALLEYMAAGRAIVATAVGGNVELIEPGVNGLLVPPGDPEALAQAVTRLLDDPDLAARFGRAARRRVEERYSLQARARRFEEFYARLVTGASATGGESRDRWFNQGRASRLRFRARRSPGSAKPQARGPAPA
jgi:glycosyltransferase involved in cell wall biosynthesis